MMNNVSLTFLIVLMLAAVGVLFMLNFTSSFQVGGSRELVSTTDVKGMAVKHKNVLYTLNLDQQTEVIALINQARPTSQTEFSIPAEVQKIIIYRFSGKPQEVAIKGKDENENFLFSFAKGVYKDTSDGTFSKLISKTYDH